jgi:diguanylate cyclase (GGDEF)-like protein
MMDTLRDGQLNAQFTQRVRVGLMVLFTLMVLHPLVLFGNHSAFSGNTRLVSIVFFLVENLVALLAFISLAGRERSKSRRVFTAWMFAAFSLIFIAIGDCGLFIIEIGWVNRNLAALPNLAFLGFYPLIFTAILLLPFRDNKPVERTRALLDTGMVLLGCALVFWNFLLGPLLEIFTTQPLWMKASSATLLGGDLMLLAAVLVLIYWRSPNLNSWSVTAFILAILIQIAADSSAVFFFLQNIFEINRWQDCGYALGRSFLGISVLLQLAYLNRDPFILSFERIRLPRVWQTVGKFFLPYSWLVFSYALLIWRHTHILPMTFSILAGGVGLMIGLVVVRQVFSLRENAALNISLSKALDDLSEKSIQLEEINRHLQIEIQEHQKAKALLSYEAMHDGLTGLPNRSLLLDRMRWVIQLSERNRKNSYAVMFLDLDHFKVVNDSMGHTAGDQLLVEVTRRLKECLRTSDMVARLGGDEFVLLLSGIGTEQSVQLVADRVQEEIRQPFELNGQAVFISASIGIVANLLGYTNPEDVLRDADIAMYHAKAMGKARHEIFHLGMRTLAISRQEMEHDLRRGLDAGEFELEYQPIVSLQSGAIAGFEALVRWRHPNRGTIPPLGFIPVAEETGLILPLGRQVLYEACRMTGEWIRAGLAAPNLFISVNISTHQFVQKAFLSEVEGALSASGLEATNLKLEITESVFLKKDDQAILTFHCLAQLGVECELDDFGTGYSALSYINNFPIRTIKIDRSFIHAIRAAGKTDVVRALLTLSRDLKLEAIAEGLETRMQLDELRGMGCRLGQGFYLHRPMGADRIHELLAGQQARVQKLTLKEAHPVI